MNPQRPAYETGKLPLLYLAIILTLGIEPIGAGFILPGVSENGSCNSLWWLRMELNHLRLPYEGSGQPLSNSAMLPVWDLSPANWLASAPRTGESHDSLWGEIAVTLR